MMQRGNHMTDIPRYDAGALATMASQLFARAGLPADRAQTMAETLLEGDLMGHSTHGLALLSPYLLGIENGEMAKTGLPDVLADHGAAVTWDGRYLPGPWLVHHALDLAFERVKTHPVVTVVIRRSHHIACLAAYPKRATDQGLFMLLTCSDPNEAAVAPYGGLRPIYTPNPLAAGIPTQGTPIIIDISMSTTSNGFVARHQQTGQMLPGEWLLDNQGNPTADPNAKFTDPPGSALPLGGMDLGYKGFALGLLIEAMTSALAGQGRTVPPGQWGASVFLQVIDPEAFGGRDGFAREMEWLAEESRTNPTQPGKPPVRLPGSRGLQLRAEQLEQGVALYPTIMPALQSWAEKLGVELPAPLG
jgi:L-lactate dehydrogenase